MGDLRRKNVAVPWLGMEVPVGAFAADPANLVHQPEPLPAQERYVQPVDAEAKFQEYLRAQATKAQAEDAAYQESMQNPGDGYRRVPRSK